MKIPAWLTREAPGHDVIFEPDRATPGAVRERSTIAVDAVFDIETWKWSNFLCAGFLTRGGKYRAWTWKHEREFVEFLLAFKGTIWSHNGGKFDILWFASWLSRLGVKAIIKLAGQRIISLRVGKLVMRDSAALIPFELKKAAKLGRFEKLECPIPFESFSPKMTVRGLRAVMKYMKGDSVCLLDALIQLEKWAEVNDVDLAGTIGSAAYKTVSRRYNLPDADWSDATGRNQSRNYDYLREAYFGGRVSVFQTRAVSGFRYDANSAYPYAMSTVPMPVGTRHHVDGSAAQFAYDSGKDGIYTASVDVPKMYVPPLPMRGINRIGFPYGRFSGVWTGLELRYAASVGVEIQKITKAVFWDRSEVIFDSFCKQFFDIRKEKGPETAWGQFCKWFPNACSGKFAMGPEMDRVIMNPEEEPNECPMDGDCRGRCHPRKGCCPHKCWNRCARPINRERTIWALPTWRLDPCAHVHWAGHITAHARTRLHSQLTADGRGGFTACYSDTDSCFATIARAQWIGIELGQWKYEGTFRPDPDAEEEIFRRFGFVALAPKTYAYTNEAGKRKARSKGIPDAVEHFQALMNGEEIPVDRGVMTFRSAARSPSGELFQRKNMKRKLKKNGQYVGDRKVDKDGRTWPVDAREFMLIAA